MLVRNTPPRARSSSINVVEPLADRPYDYGDAHADALGTAAHRRPRLPARLSVPGGEQRARCRNPWLLKSAIDVLRGAHGALALEAARRTVTHTALAIVACALLQAIIPHLVADADLNAGRNIQYGLQRDLFGHLVRMDPAFYRQHPTGDLMSRLTNDLGAVRMLFSGFLNPINTLFIYISTLTPMLRISPRLTLFALLPYPALILGGRALHAGDVPREPRSAGTNGAHVDRRAGGSGQHGGQTVRAGAAAPRRLLARERSLPRPLAAPGARARHPGPAVRNVRRRGHAHRPLAGRARGDSGPPSPSAAWWRSTLI